jgi:hypothetical protein
VDSPGIDCSTRLDIFLERVEAYCGEKSLKEYIEEITGIKTDAFVGLSWDGILLQKECPWSRIAKG